MDRKKTRSFLFIAACAMAAFACSGEEDVPGSGDSTSLEFIQGASLDPDEREAEFQRQLATPLGAGEMIAVEERLHELGVDMTEVTFSGRMLAFGDALLSADALLSRAEETGAIEKGNTLGVVDNTSSVDGQPLAPVLFSSRVNNVYRFHRPDIIVVAIVIPNTAAASFLVGAFQTASSNVFGAANDCLSNTGGVAVMTQTQWNALGSLTQRFYKPIFVRYGSSVCGFDVDAKACSIFPRLETRDFGNSFLETRLVPGTRIGVVSTAISSVTTENIGTLMHELLHTLGVAHPSDPNGKRIIQTSSVNTVASVMQSCIPGSIGCNITFTLSPDDIDVIDTLYSPQGSSDTCAYAPGLKTLVAN